MNLGFHFVVRFLEIWTSDHSPILLNFRESSAVCQVRRSRPRFHYELLWKNYEECRIIVQQCWQPGHELLGNKFWNFQHNVANCVSGLQKWSACHFKGRRRLIDQKIAELLGLKQ